ncbi:MAG: RT0821/Lpp0805 family surface protein [Alphaproteobacteria bacterium]
MFKRPIIIVALSGVLLAGCAEGREKETVGTLVGAGLGALIGSQVGSGRGQMAAVAIGALGGAWAGNVLGKSLDEADKAKLAQTAQNSLENSKTGQLAAWNNPDSGNSGTFTPVSTYKQDGKDCRTFESTITVDGKTEPATGKACRNADGTWTVVN